MALEDPQDPAFELRLIMRAALEAVKAFNAKRPDVIRVIGFWTGHLCIDQLTPEHVGDIVRSVYAQTLSSAVS